MEHLKKYDEFVNEEFRFLDIAKWAAIGTILASIFVVWLASLILLIPYDILRMFYQKYYNKNWAIFARGIQTTMDLLWTYSYYIKEIEDHNHEGLNKKQIDAINKVKGKLKKQFGKVDVSKDDVKEWCRDKFDKISKEEDREEIYDMIDVYELKILPIDKKLSKKLKSIYNYIGAMEGVGVEDNEDE